MNTGLLTVYNQEIVAIFSENDRSDKQPWFLNGFFKETDKFFTTNFSSLPPLADYSNKELISVLLDAAKGILEKKLKRNFKLALPFCYHNTETGENKIQLLAPLFFPGAPVRLAL